MAERAHRSPGGGVADELETLLARELSDLEGATPVPLEIAASVPPEEAAPPTGAARRLAPRDTPTRFGLALSGGGIRSATFNLGVLQTLERLRLLVHVDVLSTVSGGGYVGGWYSRWRARHAGSFPTGDSSSAELIHLRRFASFLWPRWALLSSDTGAFVSSLLGSFLPTLVATLALLLLGHLVFYALVLGLSPRDSSWMSAVGLGLGALAFQVWREEVWFREQDGARKEKTARGQDREMLEAGRRWGWIGAGLAAALAAALLAGGLGFLADKGEGLATSSPRALVPALALALVAVLWFVLRFALSTLRNAGVRLACGAQDRNAARLLGLALVWILALGTWRIATALHALNAGIQDWVFATGLGTSAMLGGAVQWIVRSLANRGAQSENGTRRRTLALLTPQLASWLALGLVLVLTAALWQRFLPGAGGAWTRDMSALAGACLGVTLLVLLLFDPRTCSLHEPYRARIARAFLGAGFDDQTEERVDPRDSDDVPLTALGPRPLHLICCAANDLASNDVATLNRGAESAVLSRHGLQVGTWWIPWRDGAHPRGWRAPSLGSAITASAAAFNPNMGAQSKQLGKAVTFLLAALNLRLGLWLPGGGLLPGLLFYRELFQDTRVRRARPVHLSDGAHFENLALYELVRRRCRLIVVADCGADPNYEFADVGNCIRRLRQDFDVDVRIDLSALRPGPDGRVAQHAAVGDVFYEDGDSGVLVLLKPGLSGDEPGDVVQYKTLNATFPQETTGDQFYDHEQWESYRRLGQHVAEQAFGCLDRQPGMRARLVKLEAAGREERLTVLQAVFGAVRQDLYPTPPDYTQRFEALTERCHEVEERLRAGAPAFLLEEVFPEVEAGKQLVRGSRMPRPEDWLSAVELLIVVTQLMEDVWQGLELDRYRGHPLNLGWVNYFHRWANTATFRMWWPVLRPMWSPGLQHYLEREFDLGTSSARWLVRTAQPDELVRDGAPPALRAWFGRRRGSGNGPVLVATIELTHARWKTGFVPFGGALVAHAADDGAWELEEKDLWVAPGLWSIGIGSSLLARLVDLARAERRTLRATLDFGGLERMRSDAARLAMADRQRFFEGQGFRVLESQADRRVLVRTVDSR